MFSISIDINPYIVQSGLLTITWHGLLVALGLAIGLLVSVKLAKKVGIQAVDALPVILCGIIAAIIFARLFHVIDDFSYYWQNPMEIFNISAGGAAIYGAIVGGAIGGILYNLIRKRSWEWLGRISDSVAPGLVLGMAIGRVGCLINGDAYGTLTSLPWGVYYTHPNAGEFTKIFTTGGQRYIGHPAPAYEIIWDLLILCTILLLRRKVKVPGVIYITFLLMYSVGRFFISMLRVNDPFVGSLNEAQFIAIVLVAICIPMLIILLKKGIPFQKDEDNKTEEIEKK